MTAPGARNQVTALRGPAAPPKVAGSHRSALPSLVTGDQRRRSA
jgi:hypothetical protein